MGQAKHSNSSPLSLQLKHSSSCTSCRLTTSSFCQLGRQKRLGALLLLPSRPPVTSLLLATPSCAPTCLTPPGLARFWSLASSPSRCWATSLCSPLPFLSPPTALCAAGAAELGSVRQTPTRSSCGFAVPAAEQCGFAVPSAGQCQILATLASLHTQTASATRWARSVRHYNNKTNNPPDTKHETLEKQRADRIPGHRFGFCHVTCPVFNSWKYGLPESSFHSFHVDMSSS